jgi:holo-ACP synthase / triphosphoribosyl-dephospho-CoA synthase
MNAILEAREARDALIKVLSSQQDATLIQAKANIPGPDKHIVEARILLRSMTSALTRELKATTHIIGDDIDGPYAILLTDHSPHEAKTHAIRIEESHPLGRLFDIDVMDRNGNPIPRTESGFTHRRCLLCDKPAVICRLEGNHRTDALLVRIKEMVKDHLAGVASTLMTEAIMRELDLEDKFGLVTPTSCGAHPDMDHQLMVLAKEAISPFFSRVFKDGWETEDDNERFRHARDFGLLAEKAMDEATGGVNCYKGLIFSSFLFLSAFGHCMRMDQTTDGIFGIIQRMTEGITRELSNGPMTSGRKAYAAHGFTGARGEAERGYPSVGKALMKVHLEGLTDDRSLRNILKDLVLASEDTVLLKRSGSYERYMAIKDMIASLDTDDPFEVRAFSRFMSDHGFSPGGAADLLVMTVFMDSLKTMFSRS